MLTSRNLLLAACGIAALTTAAAPASAQDAATASGAASVSVIAPVSVVKETDLAFGRVIRPSGGATVYTIDAGTGATNATGGNGAFFPGDTPGRATFTAFGSGGAAFTIAVDSSVVMDGITVNLTQSAPGGTLGAGTTGTATFGVGGNVTLTSAAPLGAHSGTFVVTIDYP